MGSKSKEKLNKKNYRGRGVFGPAVQFKQYKIWNEQKQVEELVVVKESLNPGRATLIHSLVKKGMFPRKANYAK